MSNILLTKKPTLSLWGKIKVAAPWSLGTTLIVGAAAGYAAWVIAPAAALYFLGHAALAVTQPVAYAAAAYITYRAAKTAGKVAVSRAEDKLAQQTHQEVMNNLDTYINRKIKAGKGREAAKRQKEVREKVSAREKQAEKRRPARPKIRKQLEPVVFKRDEPRRDRAA